MVERDVQSLAGDIDIDIADREKLLKLIPHTRASQYTNGELRRHNSGFYATPIPYDPFIQAAAIDYETAEKRGYVKIDLLNMSVYELIRDQAHYKKLLADTPPWERLLDKKFCRRVIHLSNWHHIIKDLREPIDSIPRLMMFLALIRPAKKHMIGYSWKMIAETIWDRDAADGYSFRKSHACAYAHLVVLHMNILNEQHGSTRTLSTIKSPTIASWSPG
jgi:hypothetical protein